MLEQVRRDLRRAARREALASLSELTEPAENSESVMRKKIECIFDDALKRAESESELSA